MNKVQLAVLSTLVLTQVAHARVIYGEDHRVEVSEATPFQQKIAKAAASMISANEMTRDPSKPGLVQFTQRTLREWLESEINEEKMRAKSLFSPKVREAAANRISFCAGERFVDQPNPSMCSGFLIAEDLVVTAGHCVEIPNFCDEYKWVFGFEVNAKTKKAGVNIKEEDIYSCKKVVSSSLSMPLGLDYAVIQLDRTVSNREPVEIRNDGMVENNLPLFVVGSPSGLPLKVAGGANVRLNNHPFYFNANLDTFQGNSGSGVFNAKTGVVEGILVRGEEDFVPNQLKMCIEANKCADDKCRGEDITRMTAIPEVGVQRALNRAAETGDVVTLERILKLNIWVDFYTKGRESSLIKAAKNAKTKSLELLIAKGADVNLQDAEGNTALHHLVRVLNKKTETALVPLINAHIRTDIRNKKGETAFDIAKSKNPEALKIFQKLSLK